MHADARHPPTEEVTLGLMNREHIHGRLTSFSPLSPCLHLACHEEGSDGQIRGRARRIASDEIAYIGFHRRKSSPHHPPRLASMRLMNVHTSMGDSFRVIVAPSAHPNGFYAFPEQSDSPYERMFFYHHGVRVRENPKPIGEVLIEEQLASPEAIRQALDMQHATCGKRIGSILMETRKVRQQDIDAALRKQQRVRKRLGELLLEAGLIQPEDLERALAEQRRRHSKKLGQILTELNVITEEELASTLALKFHLPFVDLDEYPIDPRAITEINAELVLKHQCLPVAADEKSVTIAIADPLDDEAYNAVRFACRKRIHEMVATPSQLRRHIERLLGSSGADETDWLWIEPAGRETDEDDHVEEIQLLKAADAPPVVRLVNRIILGAIERKASDIHLLPQSHKLVLAYRVHGELREASTLEKWVGPRVVSRIKILAGMDITTHRLPQDGRMTVRHDKRIMELRVSCIPNAYGESIVMRVLDKEMAPDLATLGLREHDRQRLARLIQRPHGLLLATGPTGSGKSTTLFALIKTLEGMPLHIITIEDPVESEIPGANQIQVNSRVGLTFARALRNVLRHDPDVVMVGEMRDAETASIGVQAALTGHLMLSTLHTNNAVDTIIRLVDLGIPRYLLAPALSGVISQHLVPRLCPNCRKPAPTSAETSAILRNAGLDADMTLHEATGCEHCNHTGYTGRALVYEFLEVNETIRRAIHDGVVGHELQKAAIEAGMHPQARHAAELARAAIIGRDDLIRLLL